MTEARGRTEVAMVTGAAAAETAMKEGPLQVRMGAPSNPAWSML